MKRWLPVLILLFTAILPLSGQSIKSDTILYFYEEGCPQCELLSPILDELAEEYSLTIIKYDVATPEGYRLFTEYGFTTTPALYINGELLEYPFERADIVKALQNKNYHLNHYVAALILGLISGLSPTLLCVYTDIISEVARTTRREMDVVFRSLLFCAGIFAVSFCVFLIFSIKIVYQTTGALFGFVIFLNLLNSALHSFNSYTRIDLFIKAQFITLEPASVVKLGLFHGLGKFSDSLPLFFPVLYLVIVRGSFFQDVSICVLFFLGIVIIYVLLLVLAIVQLNLFRRLSGGQVSTLYFLATSFLVMIVSVFFFLEVLPELNLWMTLFLVVVVTVVSGVLIGFKRRIVL